MPARRGHRRVAGRRPNRAKRGKFARSRSRRVKGVRHSSSAGRTLVYNLRKPGVTRTVKTIVAFATDAPGASDNAFVFDPSGTFSVPAVAMPQWAGLTGLYDQYKVHKIVLTCRYVYTAPGVVTLGSALSVLGRFNYDPSVTVTQALLMQKTKVKRHFFTPESPSVSFTVYPRIQVLNDSIGALATEGRSPQKMKWCDTDFPSELWGFMYHAEVLAGASLVWDCTYHCSFKYDI